MTGCAGAFTRGCWFQPLEGIFVQGSEMVAQPQLIKGLWQSKPRRRKNVALEFEFGSVWWAIRTVRGKGVHFWV